METNQKLYPPMLIVEDYALDVASVNLFQLIDNNIARYAGRHGQSSYACSTTGVVGTLYTGLSTNLCFVGNLFHNLPTIGIGGTLAYLAGVSAYNKSRWQVVFYPSSAAPFVFNDDTARYAMTKAIYTVDVVPDSINIYWRTCVFPMSGYGVSHNLSAFLGTISTDGSTTVTTTLYSSHVETECIFE